MDIGGVGEIQAHQISSTVNSRQVTTDDAEQKEVRENQNQQTQRTEAERTQRLDDLRNQAQVSAEKNSLEQRQAPSVEESPERRGENGSDPDKPSQGIDILA